MNMRNMLPSPAPVPAALWSAGLDDLSVQVGDLWVTSWDGNDLALVVITGVHDTHVTVWLVTAESDATPAAPSFRLNAAWLETPLACWPEAQAGMSQALLSRRLGTVLTSRDIRAILADVWEPDEEANASVEYYEPIHSDQADDSLDLACRFVAMLSDLDTPHTDREPVGILSPRFKIDHHLTSPRDLSAHLTGVPALIARAFNSERLLRPDEIETLAATYHSAPDEVVTHPEDATVIALRTPKWKKNVNSLIATKDLDEADVRLRVWERANLAARQAGSSADNALDARIAHAFDQLLAE